MTAIPEPIVVPPERVVRHAQDTVTAAAVSLISTQSLPISNVPDMTVALRKDSTIPDEAPLAASAFTAEAAREFVLPPCPQFARHEFQPVETFVRNAIACDDPNNNKAYSVMVDAIRKHKDPPTLCKVLLALRGTTLSQLSGNPKQHERLLHYLFRLDPFLKEKHEKLPDLYSLADAHLHLLLALTSANSVFLTPAMTALWRLVTIPINTASLDRINRLHATLATMLRLVPKGNSELFPIIASSFPFRTKPRDELEWYTTQCLTVLEYVPTLHSQILELLLDKCLEMDVEIKISDAGQVSIDDTNHALDDAQEDMFELELDCEHTAKQPMIQDNVDRKVDEMADKVSMIWKNVSTLWLSRLTASVTTGISWMRS